MSKTPSSSTFSNPKAQENSTETVTMDTTPELTLRSGLATAGTALSYFMTVGFLNAFGIFQQYYTSDLLRDKSNFQISWLGSFAIFALFAFAPAAGILTDKIGPQIPIACGSVGFLIAVFMTSLCKEYWQFFLAQGLLMGVSMSFVSIPASGIVPRYFKRNRGLATGISIAGSSLGGLIWPIAFNQMLHVDGIDFPWAMRIAGFVMIPLCIFCVLTVRPPIKVQTKGSEEAGIGSVEETQAEKVKPKKDLSVLRRPPFVLLCAGLFLGIFGFFTPLFYVSIYAVHIGMSPSLGFYMVSIANGASLFGRILPGVAADRLGRFNVLTASMFFAGIIAFCWTQATNVAGLVIWTMAFGFASGAILSLQIACVTTLADADSAGAAVGIGMGSTSLATLFGTPVAGEIVKHGYLALSCFSGIMLLAGACLLAASRLYQDRRLMAKV